MTFWIILGVILLLTVIIPPKKKKKGKDNAASRPQQPVQPVFVEEKSDPFDFYIPEEEVLTEKAEPVREKPVVIAQTVSTQTPEEMPGSIYETEISDAAGNDNAGHDRKIDGKAMVIYSEIMKRKF